MSLSDNIVAQPGIDASKAPVAQVQIVCRDRHHSPSHGGVERVKHVELGLQIRYTRSSYHYGHHHYHVLDFQR